MCNGSMEEGARDQVGLYLKVGNFKEIHHTKGNNPLKDRVKQSNGFNGTEMCGHKSSASLGKYQGVWLLTLW